MRILLCLILLECIMEGMSASSKEIKSEATTIPRNPLFPPEGNRTFLDGTTWCVAQPGVSETDLQTALDWACGVGMADCTAIRDGGACYEPDTLASHASYAFNYYYQQNGNNDVGCHFGGTGALTKNNPSYGKCLYAASGSLRSSAISMSGYKPNRFKWKHVVVLLLLYVGS